MKSNTKSIIIKTLFSFFFILVFTNCTIQKRIHRSGWHIEWNKKYRSLHTEVHSTEHISENINHELLIDNEFSKVRNLNIESATSIELHETIDEFSTAIQKDKKNQESLPSHSRIKPKNIKTVDDTIIKKVHTLKEKKISRSLWGLFLVIGFFGTIFGLLFLIALVIVGAGFSLLTLLTLLGTLSMLTLVILSDKKREQLSDGKQKQ